MDILAQLKSLVDLITQLQAQLADVPAALDAMKKEGYDKGFADGVASVPKSDKIYSQEELDKSVSDAVAPLQAKVAELEAVVAGVDQKIADAVVACKADLKAKYHAAVDGDEALIFN